MQSRILFWSRAVKAEHIGVKGGIKEVVEVTAEELGEAGEAFLALFDSPSAKTHDLFIPAFSQAWKRQNWQFFRVFKVMLQLPPLLHL